MKTIDMREGNISPFFAGNEAGKNMATELCRRAETDAAAVYFLQHCDGLLDYDYWFLLSTLWVSYSGWTDLETWKALFSSDRPNRDQCIMKPNEYRAFKALRNTEVVYRAQRPGETDWIAYTFNPKIARRMGKARGITQITKFEVDKESILAVFLRRGEDEIIVLDKDKARVIGYID